MKTAIKVLAALALALALFGQYSDALAGDIFKTKGLGAEAYFFSVDPSGCVVTDVGVFARDETFQNPPGSGDPSSWVFLYISQNDYCNGVQVVYADGFTSLANPDLQVSRRLDLATLTTTVNVYDYFSGTSYDVYVDLSWQGSGPPTRQSSHFHTHSPTCNINSRFNGTFRFGGATGSVSDGTTNFTPETAYDARLFSVKSGDVFVGCS
jgi:hypothetical protein